MDSYYDVLGIAPDATQDEIAAQFRELANRFHPDRHPDAPPELTTQYTAAMSRITEAYQTLKSPARRADYDLTISRGGRSAGAGRASAFRYPRPGECDLCGWGEADDFEFRYQRAYLLGARLHTIDAELCRSCALAFGRTAQNRTLWTGWFGLFSFFRNLHIVFTNARALRLAGDLPDPQPPADHGVILAPLPRPAPAGASVWRRSGVWVAAAVLAALVAIGATSEDPATGSAAAGGSAVEWADGVCVRIEGDYAEPTSDCSTAHGRVLDHVATPADCQIIADTYIEDGGDVFCINLYGG